jgi:hypothetical protein
LPKPTGAWRSSHRGFEEVEIGGQRIAGRDYSGQLLLAQDHPDKGINIVDRFA